jgi:hypothetical protein
MYANFTEETCTGTGATLVLTGATTGSIQFSKTFSDGDEVAYALEDSGGTILIAGVGVYVSATDDITRNDTWNWNGTVVDKNPSTNITLSGGTHTIRCDVVGERLFSGFSDNAKLVTGAYFVPDNVLKQDVNAPANTTDRMCVLSAVFLNPVIITSMVVNITTLDGSATNTRQGVYSSKDDGTVGDILGQTGNIDVSTTGKKVTALGSVIKLDAGRYFFAFVSDSAGVVRVRAPSNSMISMVAGGFTTSGVDRASIYFQNGVTGAMPTTPTISATGVTQFTCPMGFE